MTGPRRRERTMDDGFTLTELLVSIGLFSVVSAMVTTAAVTGLHQQTQVANRSDALAAMRTVLQRIDRDIRTTYPLLSASPTQIVLRDVQPSVTRVVTYAVSGTTLTKSETETTASGATTTVGPTAVLTNLTTSAVFSFAPVTGYAAPAGSGVDPTTCVMANNAIDPGCVGTITVQLVAQPPFLATALTMTDNGTELRNAS